jgi:hypothetical protein
MTKRLKKKKCSRVRRMIRQDMVRAAGSGSLWQKWATDELVDLLGPRLRVPRSFRRSA